MKVKRGEHAFAQLTAKELQIFSVLHREQGKRLTRQKLQSEVWGDVAVGGKALDVHLFNLRRKIAALGVEILHEEGDGYMLVVNKK
jgi:DNA-binding response OmpR family regulator